MLISKKVDDNEGDVDKKQPADRTLGESLKKHFIGSDEPTYITIKKDGDSNPDKKTDQTKEV